MHRFLIVALLSLVAPTARAQQTVDEPQPKKRDAASIADEGNFLSNTMTARVSDHRVMGMVLGGYDSTARNGGTVNAVVEAALANRVALRVGADYVSGVDAPSLSAGLRFGVLRQELNGFDLGVSVTYRTLGFTESGGDVELGLLASRRWGRLGVFANFIYGQGITTVQRDAQVRAAAQYSITERLRAGIDGRCRFNLGQNGQAADRQALQLATDFDLLVGPAVSYAIGPVALLLNAGVHTITYDPTPSNEVTATGVAATGGVGASF